MQRFDDYPTSSNRCLLNWQTFRGFDLSRAKVLERLENRLGFIPVEIDLVQQARRLIGKGEYVRRCDVALAPVMVDCSSLMLYLFSQIGVGMRRLAIDQRDSGERISIEEARAGDLVFSTGKYGYYLTDSGDDVGHVGLATGEGTVIHAYNPDPESERPLPAIHEEPLEDFLAGREARGACRILPPAQDRLVLKIPEGQELPWSREAVWLFSTTFASSAKSSTTKVA